MVASQNKRVFRTTQNSLHAATISFYPRCRRIVKVTAVNSAPKIGIKFEVSTAPLASHGAKQVFEVFLYFRMCSIQYEPWTTTPSAESYPIRTQRVPVRIFDEPVRVLRKNVRLLFGNERRYPDRRLEATSTNLF